MIESRPRQAMTVAIIIMIMVRGANNRRAPRWPAAFVTDWSMLWKEILGGFLIAGFLATLTPHGWWEALFLESGPLGIRLIENALVGPVIAVISFVCSMGNIPLANLLWAHGISFGGVISFIYADLIVIPLILIYAKYYGARAAAWITGILYLSMVIAGIIVDLLSFIRSAGYHEASGRRAPWNTHG